MNTTRATPLLAILLCACATAPARTRETNPAVSGEMRTKGGIQYVDVAQGSGAPMAAR